METNVFVHHQHVLYRSCSNMKVCIYSQAREGLAHCSTRGMARQPNSRQDPISEWCGRDQILFDSICSYCNSYTYTTLAMLETPKTGPPIAI